MNVKFHRIKRSLFRRFLNLLPFKVRSYLVRRSVQLPSDIPDDFTFRVAQNEADLEASFRLVYEAYVELGYCEPNPHKMRATIYHSLATTSTLLALYKNQVVGTLTLVRDNRHKLPLEQTFDVSSLRVDANRLAEVTSLAIHKDFRRENGGVTLFPLLRLMYQYAYDLFGVNHLVITVHPKARHFYESLMLFNAVADQGVKDYLGAPAICLHLDLEKAEDRYLKTYGKCHQNQNLYDFFLSREIPQIKLPLRTWNKIYDPIVTVEYFESFFVKKLGLPRHLPGDRRDVTRTIMRPRAPRYETTLHVSIHPEGWNESVKGVIKDISKNGFRLFTKVKIQPDRNYDFIVSLSEDQTCTIKATPVWGEQNRGIGFRIIEAPASWYRYVKYLDQELAGKKVS